MFVFGNFCFQMHYCFFDGQVYQVQKFDGKFMRIKFRFEDLFYNSYNQCKCAVVFISRYAFSPLLDAAEEDDEANEPMMNDAYGNNNNNNNLKYNSYDDFSTVI